MENINVYIRLKPIKDKSESNFSFDSKTITNLKTKEIFNFDSVITPTMSNKDIFEKLIKQNLVNLLKGINVSIFAYGQTSTGKTFTMKGEPKLNEGLIPQSIKEIFNSLNNKESSISKYLVKVSYIEIYNETVNDLIDPSKKNLEIRESGNKGIFVNNLSEISVNNLEKAMQLLNKGESNRIIAETKLNEKSSRSHTIFKINIEFYMKEKNNNKEKKYNSQLNLVDLAGSENVSKAKCEGIRIKEGGNINKSLLALSNVINKLSQNNKSFVNYRDSKLTRLLQTSLGGNSKTTIICTMVDDNSHYSETLNTLHFGIKAKNIKTIVKVNEVINDKGKIAMENQALRNKIKMLEKLINDKKSLKEKENNNEENKGNKTYSILSSGNKNDIQNNEQISNLEKEVSLLKRYLMNNEEIGSDLNSMQGAADWMSVQGGDMYNNIYNINSGMSNINTSGYKPSFTQRISNLSAIRGSESAIKSSYFNSPCMPRQYPPDFNNNVNNANLNHFDNFKKNVCMTEMRSGTYVPKIFFHSAIRKTAPQNTNFLFGSNIKFSVPDLNNLNNTSYDMESGYLMKENEELKKNIYELKKTYYEVVQSKEQQIKLLNQNHDMTLENCEKLIKEAEANYMNLKKEYDQVMEKMKIKDNELNDLKQKNISQDSSINYYKKELNKVKDLNYASEIEAKYNSLLEENIKLKQKDEEETSKLKEENDLLKKNIDMIDNKYKEKCQELNDNQKIINETKMQHEKEVQKYKNEIKNYRNSVSKGGKNQKNNKGNILDNDKIKEYEEQINKLIQENNDYKNNIEKIEKTQIVEYQKLLDDSFAKIAQLNKELIDSKDKNKYLEKALNIVEKKTKKDDININKDNSIELNEQGYKQDNRKENENKKLQSSIKQNKKTNNFTSNGRVKNIEYSNEERKDFLNKKTKGIPKIYQQMISGISGNNNTPNKENNNIINTEFSNFEI